MTERDRDERALRRAFARLRDEEARSAPSLARLLARAESARAERRPLRAWLRLAVPAAGAAAAGAAAVAWWLAASAPRPATEPPLIALGSLHSPTDVLLEPPLGAVPSSLFESLIPGPPPTLEPPASSSRLDPARRYPA